MMLSTINGINFASKCNGIRWQKGNNNTIQSQVSQADKYERTLQENEVLKQSLRFACKVIAQDRANKA